MNRWSGTTCEIGHDLPLFWMHSNYHDYNLNFEWFLSLFPPFRRFFHPTAFFSQQLTRLSLPFPAMPFISRYLSRIGGLSSSLKPFRTGLVHSSGIYMRIISAGNVSRWFTDTSENWKQIFRLKQISIRSFYYIPCVSWSMTELTTIKITWNEITWKFELINAVYSILQDYISCVLWCQIASEIMCIKIVNIYKQSINILLYLFSIAVK